MPRHVDQDVHSAFVEFRAEQGDKCMSVQCIYCQQTRAKNTTRQKQHLLSCPQYLEAHPDVASNLQAAAAAAGAGATADDAAAAAAAAAASSVAGPSAYPAMPGEQPTTEHTNLSFMPNPRINGTPMAAPGRASLGPDGTPAPKRQKVKNASFHEIPLREVHEAFEEFKAKDDDKCMSARCLFCGQVRAKNTSRQREHLLACPGYQTVLKEKLPVNNLRHQFDDDDVASSLSLPTPTLELDFRISIRVKPKLSAGLGAFGRESWISCIGGQWAGRFGKGVVLPGGQDVQTTVKDMATRIDARYVMQTNDENPAIIICKIKGWWTGERDVMERLQDPVAADNVAAHRYLLRTTLELETGDPRYANLNTAVYLASGARRGAEIVYDAYRIG